MRGSIWVRGKKYTYTQLAHTHTSLRKLEKNVWNLINSAGEWFSLLWKLNCCNDPYQNFIFWMENLRKIRSFDHCLQLLEYSNTYISFPAQTTRLQKSFCSNSEICNSWVSKIVWQNHNVRTQFIPANCQVQIPSFPLPPLLIPSFPLPLPFLSLFLTYLACAFQE